jgi:plastocyanin
MPRKGKRRREAHRQRVQKDERRAEPDAAGEAAPSAAAEVPHARTPARKPARRARSQADTRQMLSIAAWFGAAGLVIGGIALVIVLIVTSGSSGTEFAPGPSETPDPRVAGQTPAVTVQMNQNDSGQATNARFEPNSLSGKAGELIEIDVKNVGSVAHNLHVAGADNQYDTRDDWLIPRALQPGEEAKLLVKIAPAGTYQFRCDLHPVQQVGTLVLQ